MILSRAPSWCCWPRLCRSRVCTTVSGVAPRPFLPSDSDSSWSYHKPSASSFFDQTAITRVVLLRSSVIRWLTAANCSTGLRSNGSSRNRLVIAAAPSSRARTSSPMTAAGKQADRREDAVAAADVVRDRQDVVVREPSARHRSRSLPLGPVIGTIACLSISRLAAVVTRPPRPHRPVRGGGLERAARLADDDDAPAFLDHARRHARSRCRSCCPARRTRARTPRSWSTRATTRRARPPASRSTSSCCPPSGYAWVGVNIRGTGCSGGAFNFFENLQALDGYDAIETIAAQPWSNGHVGMVGISYAGISQLFVARTQPAAPRRDHAAVGHRRHVARDPLPRRHPQQRLRGQLRERAPRAEQVAEPERAGLGEGPHRRR